MRFTNTNPKGQQQGKHSGPISFIPFQQVVAPTMCQQLNFLLGIQEYKQVRKKPCFPCSLCSTKVGVGGHQISK